MEASDSPNRGLLPSPVSDKNVLAFVGSVASLPVRRSDQASGFTPRLCVRTTRVLSNNRPRSRGAPPPGNRTNFTNPSTVEVDIDIPRVLPSDLRSDISKWNIDVRASSSSSTPEKAVSPSNTIPNVQPFDSSVVYDEEEDDDDDLEEEEDIDPDAELDAIDLEQDEDESDTVVNPKRNVLDDFEDDDEDLGDEDSPSQTKPKSAMGLDPGDDGPNAAELLQVDTDLLDINSVIASSTNAAADTVEEEPSPASLLAEEELEDPSEAELQSAAEILTGTGLLSLGKSKKESPAPVASLSTGAAADDDIEGGPVALEKGKGKKKGLASEILFEDDDEDDDGEPLELEDDDGAKEEDAGLEGYCDVDEDEEAEFTLTSQTEGSFGRLWELNEDSYVTITDAGQTYAYELDEVDSDDQEMSNLRRGAKGGWGSGLQNDAQNKHAPGSREWIARRSYDLIASTSPREMRLWTKKKEIPPGCINALYMDNSDNTYPAQAIVGKGELETSKPKDLGALNGEGEEGSEGDIIINMGMSGERAEFGNDEFLSSSNSIPIPKDVARSEKDYGGSGNAQARSALERAVKFPCSFKFKVEGSGGEGLIQSLSNDVKRVLAAELPRSSFAEEPAGRYTRVVFAVEVAEAKHVTDLYDAFRQNPLVKFSYG